MSECKQTILDSTGQQVGWLGAAASWCAPSGAFEEAFEEGYSENFNL